MFYKGGCLQYGNTKEGKEAMKRAVRVSEKQLLDMLMKDDIAVDGILKALNNKKRGQK